MQDVCHKNLTWESRYLATPPLVRRNSILMTRHYPDLSSAFDWSYREEDLLQPIRSKSGQYFIIIQYGISELIPQTSFCVETNGGVAKCRLFTQANMNLVLWP